MSDSAKFQLICDCGDFIVKDHEKFRDYIKTTKGPSTPTVGHTKCGSILDFIDHSLIEHFSSKKVLKSKARDLAKKNNLSEEMTCKFLLEIDKLKSGNYKSKRPKPKKGLSDEAIIKKLLKYAICNSSTSKEQASTISYS
jgi:hypothetical protein